MIRLLSVASEVFPLVKTGGLADVVGALPTALAAQGVGVVTLVPGYPAVLSALLDGRPVAAWPDLMGGRARLLRGRAAGLDLLVLDAPHLYDRPGNIYLGPDGQDWPDNAQRFAALSRAAADIGQGLLADWVPEAIHAHDWQAALVPAYLRYDEADGPPVVLTVHNLAFQGRFPTYLLGPLGLPAAAYDINGLEYFGDIAFLKGGLLMADRITTVSPTYAREIAGEAGGMGLGGLLAGRGGDLSGIINGIDTDVWNPAEDATLAVRYADPASRAPNKAALQREAGLDADPLALLTGVVSRLTGQKGMDLLLAALPRLLAEGGQLALLGSGDPTLEAGFLAAAAANPGRVAVRIGYDEAYAHRIQAGADALLVPSRFEPCGLTQLCALRYGCVPIVARVGGLADTVVDANEAALAAGVATGLQHEPTGAALEAALTRAGALHRDAAAWERLQRNGMAADVSWTRSAGRYAALFREVLSHRAPANAGARVSLSAPPRPDPKVRV